jgi:hypothetical protein
MKMKFNALMNLAKLILHFFCFFTLSVFADGIAVNESLATERLGNIYNAESVKFKAGDEISLTNTAINTTKKLNVNAPKVTLKTEQSIIDEEQTGFGVGVGPSMLENLHFNHSERDAKLTPVAPALRSTGESEIVTDHLHMQGGVIDTPNGTVKATEITHEDVHDHDHSSSINLSVSGLSELGKTTPIARPELNGSVEPSYSSRNFEATNRATIDENTTIETESDISGLNRDASQSRVVTRDDASEFLFYSPLQIRGATREARQEIMMCHIDKTCQDMGPEYPKLAKYLQKIKDNIDDQYNNPAIDEDTILQNAYQQIEQYNLLVQLRHKFARQLRSDVLIDDKPLTDEHHKELTENKKKTEEKEEKKEEKEEEPEKHDDQDNTATDTNQDNESDNRSDADQTMYPDDNVLRLKIEPLEDKSPLSQMGLSSIAIEKFNPEQEITGYTFGPKTKEEKEVNNLIARIATADMYGRDPNTVQLRDNSDIGSTLRAMQEIQLGLEQAQPYLNCIQSGITAYRAFRIGSLLLVSGPVGIAVCLGGAIVSYGVDQALRFTGRQIKEKVQNAATDLVINLHSDPAQRENLRDFQLQVATLKANGERVDGSVASKMACDVGIFGSEAKHNDRAYAVATPFIDSVVKATEELSTQGLGFVAMGSVAKGSGRLFSNITRRNRAQNSGSNGGNGAGGNSTTTSSQPLDNQPRTGQNGENRSTTRDSRSTNTQPNLARNEQGDPVPGLTGRPPVHYNHQGGRSFQDKVTNSLRAVENKQSFNVKLPDGRTITTIPDFFDKRMAVTEVKNQINITNSTQLKAQAELARLNNKTFNLIISPRTKTISRPLAEAIRERGGRIIEFNPHTEKWSFIENTGQRIVR